VRFIARLNWRGIRLIEDICRRASTHAFRRGLATNLHYLRVDDKTIQAILRHSNIGLTMNVYVNSSAESGVNAMDLLAAELKKRPCNNLETNGSTRPN
jgi:integrase